MISYNDTNQQRTIFSMLLATIAATSVLALCTSDVSFAVLKRILGHLNGVDDSVKDVGDDVADIEHDLGDSVDKSGENVGNILSGDD